MSFDSSTVPPLPAPTETETENLTPTDLTHASKFGDELSTYSLPEDGTPVTIRTRSHQHDRSQTSLLIEYFEGAKGTSSSTSRKPSVRVRLTPSRNGSGDHIQLTETRSSHSHHQSSHSHQFPFALPAPSDLDDDDDDDNHSMASYASATEESNVSRNPIEIEIEDPGRRRRRPASPLIPSTCDSILPPPTASDISAIPTDSFLDGSGGSNDLKGPSKNEPAFTGAPSTVGSAVSELKNHKNRSGNRDRVKIPDKARERPASSERKRRSKSRASSVSEKPDDVRSSSHRRRSSRSQVDSTMSGGVDSVLSSNLSPSHRSIDTHSTRSGITGVSKSSINNPKLLETVEDAIRRLILPELSAIKREQSKRESKRESRRGSFTSTIDSLSREDLAADRRRSSGLLGKEGSVRSRNQRNREARHDYADDSPYSMSQESIHDEYAVHDGESSVSKRNGDLLKAAAAGSAAGKGLSAPLDERSQSDDRRERRRRRAESGRSHSLARDRYSEEYDGPQSPPAPPMPLMSEVNPSEITRASILSADTDRPHSASEELTPVKDPTRGLESSGSTPTPTKSPSYTHTFGTKHANISHGDLTALPRGKKELTEEFENDEYDRKFPIAEGEPYEEEVSDPGDYPENEYENSYYNTQDVPPPLKYVPYQGGARGLSPIPSVSGYTEGGGSDLNQARKSRSMQSTSDVYSAHGASPDSPHDMRSMKSMGSISRNMRNQYFDQMSANDPRNTNFGEDSEVSAGFGQEVRGVGANPNIIHPPNAIESHVASLIDGSMLEQSVLTNGSGYGYNGARDSNVSYDRQSKSNNRGISPEKRSAETSNDARDERPHTPSARSNKQSEEFSEYEIDEHGRKVPKTQYRHSPTASEAAITAGAVGAAAKALKAAQGKKQATVEDVTDEYEPAGVARNKSFKERTMDGYEPRNTPAHSVDRLDYEDDEPQLGASGMPDQDDPLPEIGYVDDDARTISTLGQQGHNEQYNEDDWSGRATPTQRDAGLGLSDGKAATQGHSREPSQDYDEWHRTSEERKRDTLITNPYEDASPVANPALDGNLLGGRGFYHSGSPGFGQKYDEGYMSNGANRTPDIVPNGKAIGLGAPINFGGEDPYYSGKNDQSRHISGMSQGMGTPMFDPASGQGIDRIENQDIVALMQHLMVRDAQRSARDTEIVALLMNAALEMRNNFREMKDLIQDTGDDVIFSNAENTEKLQKAINGPRPYPGTRSIHSSQGGTIEENVKRKNVWKRALQGLSTKGTSDLTRIEDMLTHLLDEVDVLKTQTAPVPGSNASGRGASMDNLQPEGQYEQDRGYEPEGNSTASHASQSGHLSIPQSRLANERKFSDHRISTVPENDEEYDYDEISPVTGRDERPVFSPSRPDLARGGSVPIDTPPQARPSMDQQPLSAENTPRSDKAKKHKSAGSAGWLPKISRWSNTTASSVQKVLRGKKEPKFEEYPPSRSGSSVVMYNDGEYQHTPYGEDEKLHTGFSDTNLPVEEPGHISQPSSPVPQAPRPQTYMTPEDPKYKAHRNSLNLQHPQPRPGQTERFRTALEFSAQEYDTPMTPRSTDWAGSATSLNRLPPNANRYSTASSAQREPEYWGSSPLGPPRPPKEPLDSSPSAAPLSPRNRVSKLARNSPLQNSNDEGYATVTLNGTHGSRSQYTGSPKLENRNLNAALGVPTRRPTGPRAMTPKSAEEEAAREERRRKRDTFGTVASQHTVASHNTDDTDTF